MNKKIPRIKITLTEVEANIANELLIFLDGLPPTTIYPKRMKKAVKYITNHPFSVDEKRSKIIVLEVMERHVKMHGDDRHEMYRKELDQTLSPNTNVIVKPPINGFRFLCREWNDLWNHFTKKII